MSSDHIKSISDKKKFLEAIENLSEQVKYQRLETFRNNKQLKQLNDMAKIVQEEKIVQLEKELKKMQREHKWVESSEPALDLSPAHLMKKLDIL